MTETTTVGTAPATSPRTSMDWGRGEYERTAALLIPAAEAVIRAAELRPGGSAVDVGLRHGAPLRCSPPGPEPTSPPGTRQAGCPESPAAPRTVRG